MIRMRYRWEIQLTTKEHETANNVSDADTICLPVSPGLPHPHCVSLALLELLSVRPQTVAHCISGLAQFSVWAPGHEEDLEEYQENDDHDGKGDDYDEMDDDCDEMDDDCDDYFMIGIQQTLTSLNTDAF